MFTHLHNKHGYKLLECVDPTHTDCPADEVLDLKANGASTHIFYKEDILTIRKLLGHDAEEFGTVCLADSCRKTDAAKREKIHLESLYKLQDCDSD